MSISVVTPVLNEMNFLEAHLRCALDFADEIIYHDAGSTDGSYEFLQDHAGRESRIRVFQHIQTEEPYRWVERDVRNFMVGQAHCDWICGLDADELWGHEFFDALEDLQKARRIFIRFQALAFWYAPWIIRARDYRSIDGWRRFYPGGGLVRLYQRRPYVRWYGGICGFGGNHATPQLFHLGKWSPRLSLLNVHIPYYHYHWILPPKGVNDNRGTEYRKTDMVMRTYFGDHPVYAKKYYRWWNNREAIPWWSEIPHRAT